MKRTELIISTTTIPYPVVRRPMLCLEEDIEEDKENSIDEENWEPVSKNNENKFCIPVSKCEISKPICKSVKEKNNKYTMLCRHFIRGNCTRGDNCNFAHGFDQWNPNICNFKDKCNKGDKCRWFHPERETKEVFAKRTNMI